MQNIAKLKAYFQKNPLMGFVAVIAFITIFLGIGAFIGTRPKNSADSDKVTPTPTEEVSDEEMDEDTDIDESDTDASEHKAEPTETDTEDKVTPTKSATSTPAPTATPVSQSINILGDIFSDDNCNGTQDSGESRLNEVVVNLYKGDGSAYSSVKTDSSGHYSYNGSIGKDESLSLKVEAVAPSNYTIRDAYKTGSTTVSNSSPSYTKNFPLVPNDKVSSCSP